MKVVDWMLKVLLWISTSAIIYPGTDCFLGPAVNGLLALFSPQFVALRKRSPTLICVCVFVFLVCSLISLMLTGCHLWWWSVWHTQVSKSPLFSILTASRHPSHPSSSSSSIPPSGSPLHLSVLSWLLASISTSTHFYFSLCLSPPVLSPSVPALSFQLCQFVLCLSLSSGLISFLHVFSILSFPYILSSPLLDICLFICLSFTSPLPHTKQCVLCPDFFLSICSLLTCCLVILYLCCVFLDQKHKYVNFFNNSCNIQVVMRKSNFDNEVIDYIFIMHLQNWCKNAACYCTNIHKFILLQYVSKIGALDIFFLFTINKQAPDFLTF